MWKCIFCENEDNEGDYCEQCHIDRASAEDWDDC